MEDLTCPACATDMVQVTGPPVKILDPVICMVCRSVLVLDYRSLGPDGEDFGVGLRLPTDEEFMRLMRDPQVQEMIRVAGWYHQTYGPPSPEAHPPDH